MSTMIKLCLRGIRDLFLHPGIQALTLAAITLVTLLAGLSLMILHNLNTQLKETQGHVQFQLYWSSTVKSDKVQNQWKQLDTLPYLVTKKTFTPDQGISVLIQSLELDKKFESFKGQSPLPYTALLEFKLPDQIDKTWARDMYRHLKGLPNIKEVKYNPLQVDLAHSWIEFSRKVTWPLIFFLGLILSLIVGNTIKLSLLHRWKEVEILRLVGATRMYIQLPLLAGGAFQGFLGGCVALSALKLVQLGLKDLLNFPPLWLQIHFLPIEQVGAIILALSVVGFLSSWVAVRF